MGIVAAVLLALFELWLAGRISGAFAAASIGAGFLVAAVGFWDDHSPAPAWIRFLAHVLAAVWILAILGPPPRLDLGLGVVQSRPVLYGISLLGIVWLINLTNFMDGIDGLAGAESCFVFTLGGVFAATRGEAGFAGACWAVGAASCAFLWFNWPPASIFMGDVGSGFVGVLFGVFALEAGKHNPAQLWTWMILPGCFIADATLTLLIRMVTGARFFDAHCSHAYQHAAHQWGHRPVTLAILALNLFWLAPWAALAGVWSSSAPLICAAAFAPLLAVAAGLKAGRKSGGINAAYSVPASSSPRTF